MEKLVVYHNPQCSKSRCAIAFLEEKKVDFEIRNYLVDSPSEMELSELVERLGIPAENLVRKSESVYKEIYAGKKMTNQKWIKAMVKYPKLIERPIVISNDKAVIARPTELIESLIK